jgi:hypothetical protein
MTHTGYILERSHDLLGYASCRFGFVPRTCILVFMFSLVYQFLYSPVWEYLNVLFRVILILPQKD